MADLVGWVPERPKRAAKPKPEPGPKPEKPKGERA